MSCRVQTEAWEVLDQVESEGNTYMTTKQLDERDKAVLRGEV